MHPLLFGIILVLAGLLFCFLHTYAKGILATIVYWVGVGLIAIGLLIILFPILAWSHAQIRSAIGG